MTEDAFIILPFEGKPKPPAKAEPPQEHGRYFCNLPTAQKARVRRTQAGLYFYEPIFNEEGETGRWRVGKSELHNEFTISEFDNKDEARSYLLKLLGKT
jgi:hypothetical protein